MVGNCQKRGNCKECKGRHNTLLHFSKSKNQITSQTNALSLDNRLISTPPAQGDNSESQTSMATQIEKFKPFRKRVLLCTAIVSISDNKGCYHSCRALMDSCSTSNHMTSDLARRLKIPLQYTNTTVTSLNNSHTISTSRLKATIKSRLDDFQEILDFVVVPQITSSHPYSDINISKWNIPHNLTLADPNFNMSDSIDLLLGTDTFFKVLKGGPFKIKEGLPYFQNTKFGHIIGGEYFESTYNFVTLSSSNESEDNLNKCLERFWEMESYPLKQFLSKDEEKCENYFLDTHKRNANGRYSVNLPFKDNWINLGNSKAQAIKRFHLLERRFASNSELKQQYTQFINEYENEGHMRLIDDLNDHPNHINYYMPHHAVIKPSSSTTKQRVVFDASAKSDTNLSLNDVLMVGANVQDNLFSIILRFRKYKYVFTTDITKMYRQVQVNPRQTNFQRILWRLNKSQLIKTYELTTVTYGTASAPYLATRALKQLALDEAHNFPLAAEITLRDFYVDDLLTGSDDLNHALHIQQQLILLLSKGGFTLHKWCSNFKQLLEQIPHSKREIIKNDNLSQNETIKTLGLLWDPMRDNFLFNFKLIEQDDLITKRSVLSNIAKLYDPLGLLSPVIVTAKLVMQNLWKSNIKWDEELPTQDKSNWLEFIKYLPIINNIRLERHIMQDHAQDHVFVMPLFRPMGHASIYGVSIKRINGHRRCYAASRGSLF